MTTSIRSTIVAGVALAVAGACAGSPREAFAQSARKPATTAVSSARPSPLRLGVTFTTHSMLGALVMDVLPGSPAAKAGLQPGDRILEANGQTISGAGAAVELVQQLGQNAPLHMLVFREGRRMVLETTLVPWQKGAAATGAPPAAPSPYFYPGSPVFPFRLTPADIDDQHAYGG
jgi:S1-C subfamily serine protease